ncbi:hypothetical protein KM043_013185 [Ampulex compressa]|nr:hypothetical protein KM043_013185 [Ampulex compressa]
MKKYALEGTLLDDDGALLEMARGDTIEGHDSSSVSGSVADAFYQYWTCHFGTPLHITTDEGSYFESQLFKALTQLVGANRIRTTPYHPSSNGMIERWHRTLKAALMCNQQRK